MCIYNLAEEILMLKARLQIIKYLLQTAQEQLKKCVSKLGMTTQTYFLLNKKKCRKRDFIFKMYTGIEYLRFCSLSGQPFGYTDNHNKLNELKEEDDLFFKVCRPRLNFPLIELAFRFDISN